jgi:hypothetical protein
MKPVDALARAAGQSEYADYQRMAVVQALKDVEGVPNRTGREAFKAWRARYEAAQKSAPAAAESAPGGAGAGPTGRGEGSGKGPAQEVLPPIRKLTPYNPNRYLPPAGNPSASMATPIHLED